MQNELMKVVKQCEVSAQQTLVAQGVEPSDFYMVSSGNLEVISKVESKTMLMRNME